MSDAHDHPHEPVPSPSSVPPITPEDTGSLALSEALRSSFFIIKILMVLLVLAFLFSGIRTVGPQERAIILRFGKPVGEGEKALLGPGFHWAFPPPIDEVVKIPAGLVQVAGSSAGWYATTPEMEAARTEPPPGETLNPARDSHLLTADANIIHARATLRYRIEDPIRYEFGFTNAAAFITNAVNNALYYAAAQFTVDDILFTDVTAFREKVQARIGQLIEQQDLGIAIEQTDVIAISPRQQNVRAAFNAALQAGIQRDRRLNEARSYESGLMSRAFSGAVSITNAAWTDKTRLVEFVAAEAKKFVDLLPQYEADSQLFTLLRQTETLERVFTNAHERIFIPNTGRGTSRELRLQLSREPMQPKTAPAPAPDTHGH